jgi:hypothetical protein
MWKYAGEGSEMIRTWTDEAERMYAQIVDEPLAVPIWNGSEWVRHELPPRVEAEKRPGVMIKAEETRPDNDEVLAVDRERGVVTIMLANLDDIVNFEVGMRADVDIGWNYHDERLTAKESHPCTVCGKPDWPSCLPHAPSSRTCATCSKTCDVGVKCWWCGNE